MPEAVKKATRRFEDTLSRIALAGSVEGLMARIRPESSFFVGILMPEADFGTLAGGLPVGLMTGGTG